MDSKKYLSQISHILSGAVDLSKINKAGRVASYIPELANVEPEIVNAAITLSDGELITSGENIENLFTLQSVSKVVLLIGLIEEFGDEKVFSWINAEPSGLPFSAVGHLDRFDPIPANPLINAGAMALCNYIPGADLKSQLKWVDKWVKKLFRAKLEIDENVFKSEYKTTDRNRSLLYLMRSTGVINRDVEEILNSYLTLCSYKLNIKQATMLPLILANGGLLPDGTRIISESTSNKVVSIMATCGLYDESGMYLVKTGMPAKSGVSGLIIAVVTGRGGVATYSPALNNKGTSVRGYVILQELSSKLGWHLASPWGYAKVEDNLHKHDY